MKIFRYISSVKMNSIHSGSLSYCFPFQSKNVLKLFPVEWIFGVDRMNASAWNATLKDVADTPNRYLGNQQEDDRTFPEVERIDRH